MKQYDDLLRSLEKFTPQRPLDILGIEAIRAAIDAANLGNFGVGALLIEKDTLKVKYRGFNQIFSQARSDLHAEMDVMNRFENIYKENSRKKIKDYLLLTTLEPCPMCLSRILSLGVPETYFIASDPHGGMVNSIGSLPPVWQRYLEGKVVDKADCHEYLEHLAYSVFEESLLTKSYNLKDGRDKTL